MSIVDLLVTQTLYNANLPQTQSNFHFPLDHFLCNIYFTLDLNFFLYLLRVQIKRSQLYLKSLIYNKLLLFIN